MGNRASIEQEIIALRRPDALQVIRRRKIERVRQVTGRSLLIYAVDFTPQHPIKAQIVGPMSSISLNDKAGFDEVTRNLPRDKGLDVLLHSPGGSAEATESIVDLLRARFNSIRFIIPSAVKSAATMMAMSGDELLLDEVSELGPTDPQLLIQRDNRVISAPAQAIKDQFAVAQGEINGDPKKLTSWIPILREYGPSLLAECDNHLALSRDLVSRWLTQYMFAGDPEGANKAARIASRLSDHNYFRSHSRRIGIKELQELELKIVDMREVPELHEAVRDLFTTIAITFESTGVFRLYENSQNEGHLHEIKVSQTGAQQPNASQQPNRPALPYSERVPLTPQLGQSGQTMNREDRRRVEGKNKKKK